VIQDNEMLLPRGPGCSHGQYASVVPCCAAWFMPPVVVAMMWVIILDPFQGPANYILASLGLPQSGWLSAPSILLPIFAMLDTWQAAPLEPWANDAA